MDLDGTLFSLDHAPIARLQYSRYHTMAQDRLIAEGYGRNYSSMNLLRY